MQRVLITGSTGYIGSCCYEFLKKKYKETREKQLEWNKVSEAVKDIEEEDVRYLCITLIHHLKYDALLENGFYTQTQIIRR